LLSAREASSRTILFDQPAHTVFNTLDAGGYSQRF